MESGTHGPTVALDFLGCKLNQAEVQQLAGELAAAGYRLVTPQDGPDIYVLNTCTVTQVADRKSRQLLRQARRRNPSVRLVAIGCYAGRAATELSAIEGVELVLGNEQKWHLPHLLDDVEMKRPPVPPPREVLPESGRRTRAFIRVQDGCRNACAYCIVPLVRSREESVPVGEVLDRVGKLAGAGCREVVLTGTEIGTYRHGGVNLEGLLGRILAETSIGRLRLSSLQPPEVTPGLIGLWRDPRLCPHFHLSLQSGSDAVLGRMKRRYNLAEYRRVVSLIRETVPEAAVTTDVIVGFPGETEAEFRETLEFCREMRFARIHVFPFSPRPGTAAAGMTPPVPDAVKKERSRQALALAEATARDFRRGFLGRTVDVLFEQRSGGAWSGLTGNYIRAYVRSTADLSNKLLAVKLVKLYRDGVWGEIK
ncbi:MAG TPA: tRNA (N(6)-L-threonylcarbamoyladenosine(37)-C(2))-methylthiotransferase MtaB [Dehalococcoidales bacterium]|nr:tRNA (N(6)-L-threonylcarbamoyladenosine(37)-C(2))-methylthiotransferase MtaB [Dehalococcoidales bacterium]